MYVGQKIRELRKTASLTQKELAKGIIARSYMSQLEKGVYHPSYETLNKLAKRLGCDVDTFYEEPKNNALIKSDLKKNLYRAKSFVESKSFKQANKSLDKLFDHIDYLSQIDKGIYYWIFGEILNNDGLVEESFKEYQKSKVIFYKLESYQEYVNTLISISKIYQKREQTDLALQSLQEGYAIIHSYSLSGEIKKNLFLELGILHGQLNEFKTSIYLLEQIKIMNKQSKNHYRAGSLYMSLGICYRSVGDFDKALDSYSKAIEFYKEEEDNENTAALYNNLGNIYTDNFKVLEAIDYYNKSIELYNLLGMESSILSVKSSLIRAYYTGNRIDDCINLCRELIGKGSTNPNIIGKAYYFFGLANIKNEAVPEGIGYLENAVEYFLDAENKHYLIKSYNEFGDISYKLGDYKKSSFYFQKALQYININKYNN